MSNESASEAPTVFISYSHDSAEHKEWVKELGRMLCENGVDVILDSFELLGGQDTPDYMTNGIQRSDRVLCICTDRYIQRAEEGEGGVGFEGMVITKELVERARTDKFIPIIRNVKSEAKTPSFLGTKGWVNFSDDQDFVKQYDYLLRSIYRVSARSGCKTS